MLLLHIIAVTGTVLGVLYADEQGLMWILGKKPVLSEKVIRILHYVVGIGLVLVIGTGGMLFLNATSYFLATPVFLVKMGFVLALIINSFVIDRIGYVSTHRTFASLTHKERVPVFISGAVSFIGWSGALICGLLLS